MRGFGPGVDVLHGQENILNRTSETYFARSIIYVYLDGSNGVTA